MPAELESYVAEFVARRESGEHVSPAEFAREHPALERELLQALAVLLDTEALFPAPVELPSHVGPYRVLDTLGAGGMGQVLRVEHEDEPGVLRALKLMNPAALVSPRKRERFAREIRILKGVDHPGIVKVLDAEPAGDSPYMLMELVEGRSLASLIGSARRTDGCASEALGSQLPGAGGALARTCRLVAELARTVGSLHERGVLHRDLKPSNVILNAERRPVLVDFGLAATEDADTLTQSGDLLGTPAYMAPEQVLGRPTDVRTDVYALGAILYELLALRPPHVGQDSVAVMESIKQRAIRPLHRVAREVPRALSAIVAKALAYRPRSRYENAGSLAADLEAFAAGRSPRARLRWRDRCSDLVRTRPRLVWGVALVLLSSVVGGLALLYEPPPDRADELRRAVDRATMAWAAGNMEQTKEEARLILAIDPANPTGEFLALAAAEVPQRDSDDPLIEALVTGNAAARAGDLASAKKKFREAIALDSSSPLPVIMLGQVATPLGEMSEREEQLLAALEEQPQSAALHASLGDCYLQQTYYAQAVQSLERAIALDASNPAFFGDLARCQFELGDETAALETGRRMVERFGARRGGFFLRWLMSEEKRTGEVRRILEELVETESNDAELFALMAMSFDYEERIFEAVPWYERSLSVEPDHVASLQCLAHVHSGANRTTCADCAAAFEEHPELFDPAQAERYALRFLDARRGRDLSSVNFVVDVAIRVDRREAVESKLAALVDDSSDEDFRSGVDRALRKLISSTSPR